MHFWTYLTCNYVLLTCKMKQVNKRHLLCFPYIWCKLCTHHNECLHQRRWGISILAYLSHTMIKATLSIKIALSLSLFQSTKIVSGARLLLWNHNRWRILDLPHCNQWKTNKDILSQSGLCTLTLRDSEVPKQIHSTR